MSVKHIYNNDLRINPEQSAGTYFVSCLNSAATADRLARDAALANRWRITATPTFVSGRARTVGAASDGDLEKLIDR